MEVSLKKILSVAVAAFLAGSLRAAPLPGNSSDQDRENLRQKAQQQLDRLTLEEMERYARWVDVMPGAEPGSGRPSSQNSEKKPASPEENLRGLSEQLQDFIRILGQEGHSGNSQQKTNDHESVNEVGNDDELVEYVIDMPAGKPGENKNTRVKVKARRGTMNLHKQVHELNKMLIDDVVRMGSLKAP